VLVTRATMMPIASGQWLLFPPSRPMRERFGPDFFRAVPDQPGVYLLCGPGDGVLYVGKAKNLRHRLNQYRSANPDQLTRKLRRLLGAVEHIHWDICATEAAALTREAELLRTLRPRFNTAGVFVPPPNWLGWRIDAGGLWLGVGPDTAAARSLGPLRPSTPVTGALLRLTWWAANPDATAHELPATLRTVRRAGEWGVGGTNLAKIIGALDCLSRGDALPAVETLLRLGARQCRFVTHWQQGDAETITDWADRGAGRVPAPGHA
jgi:predicted GIY-YIG superfamily endonuclease